MVFKAVTKKPEDAEFMVQYVGRDGDAPIDRYKVIDLTNGHEKEVVVDTALNRFPNYIEAHSPLDVKAFEAIKVLQAERN